MARHADAAGNEVIVCEADMNVYTQCFSYMGIHIAASRHTDEIVFQQMWQEAKDNMRESDSLQLVPERVSGMQGSTSKVKRKCIVMNAKEWTAVMKDAPQVRTTKGLPRMKVMAEDGSGLEEVYVFRWQPTSLRTVSFSTWQCVTRKTGFVPWENHWFAGQCGEVDKWARGELATDWELSAMTADNLKSVDEVAEKLDVVLEEGLVFGSVAASSGGEVGGSGSQQPTDSASNVGGDGGCDEGTQEGKVGGMHSETEKYIQKLDLTLAMSGAKMGVQAHHADMLWNKLNASEHTRTEAFRLKSHLRFYHLATSLCADRMHNLGPHELDHALCEVASKVPICGATLILVLKKRLAELKFATSLRDAKEYLRLVWCWARGPREELVVTRPLLCLIDDVPFVDKVAGFQRLCVEVFLNGCVEAAGGGKVDHLQAVLEEFQIFCDQTLCMDLSDDESALLSDVITVVGALRTLIEPSRIFESEVIDVELEHARALWNAKDDGRPCVRSVCLVVENSVLFSQRLKDLARCQTAIVELAPMLWHMVATMIGVEQGGALSSIDLREHLTQYTRVMRALPDTLISGVSQLLIGQVQLRFELSKGAAQAEGNTANEAAACKNMLDAAVATFPADMELTTMQAEMQVLAESMAMQSTHDNIATALAAVASMEEATAGNVDAVIRSLEGLALRDLPSFVHEVIGRVVGVLVDVMVRDFPDGITSHTHRRRNGGAMATRAAAAAPQCPQERRQAARPPYSTPPRIAWRLRWEARQHRGAGKGGSERR